jgi:hypothetical protein
MTDKLLNDGVLGQVVAHMYVVEFQKRGLPHAHILLILAANNKPRIPEHVDSFVSAQLPDQSLYLELYETVISCMLHGPCGIHNLNALYMVDGKCSKCYLRQFHEETVLTYKYPEYKRPNNGISVTHGGHTFTNEHVIPYNPYLSVKYNCYIIVEVANSILTVKYLYKYAYKGHDRTAIVFKGEDERQS